MVMIFNKDPESTIHASILMIAIIQGSVLMTWQILCVVLEEGQAVILKLITSLWSSVDEA